MKKHIIAGLLLILLSSIYGCKSINVGGSGEIGGVQGHGGISIPVPQTH